MRVVSDCRTAESPRSQIKIRLRSSTENVSIERNGEVIWHKMIRSGEKAMCHSLANIEHHHFKHPSHRRSGDVHVHFFGADAFSFGEGITLENGDQVQIRFDGLGRPLRNPVMVDRSQQKHFGARPL